ncbi:ABC transporter permease [Bermanella marisrubri]|uniref:Probable permease of ABC transporter n=2 Tax=Bermanella marisrubri TaxID=207949 RepID=Q1N1Z3_9GAMM|nr:probable permease of ABC transporter [Oceanobacter sp. RED65] [Bermanella marisrubri]QIZ83616.1 ABC transporter permease [Bermanella marisrubri]
MNMTWLLAKRQLHSYFATPIAYVFIFIFLVLAGVFTFYLGNFYERGQADLSAFFNFHPWLYLFFLPAIAMGLWAPERQLGTIELLMTLPIGVRNAVLGKFFAAWLFAGLALLLSFPIWLTVNYLGEPDQGVIIAGYFGSWLMAGSFLAIGSCMSATTKNQIVAFIFTVVVCFVFMVSGVPMVLDAFAWAPSWVTDFVAGLSFLTRFDAIARGVLDVRDIIYFIAMMVFWLFLTEVVITRNKAS